VVVEVFADNLLLVAVGEDDLAQFGDEFSVTLGTLLTPKAGASAKIVSLGKRYSVAKIDVGSAAKFNVGDRVTSSDWEQRQAAKDFEDVKRGFDAFRSRGGAILINGK
jgi:hypothetical protein